jgi:hypothetical protein
VTVSPTAPTPPAGRFLRLPTHWRAFLILAGAAMVVPIAGWINWSLILHYAPNDFHDYWLASKLVTQGQSPYDMQALHQLAQDEHLRFSLGGGYSYPLPFALAMIPLAGLPFDVAVVTFNVLSLVAYALTVSAWIGWAHGWSSETWRRRLTLAFGAGLYPPIFGSLAMGQANLILFPLLGLGTIAMLDGTGAGRHVWGGVLVGLAAIVKLVPGVLVVPLALGRRWGAALGIVIGAGGAFAAAILAAPWANKGSGGLAGLLDPDTYYTNQSINGFVTRLVRDSGRTVALWKGGFDPRAATVVLTAAFGLLTLALLWRARGTLATRRGAALGLGLTLAAGIVGAPKESFWNQAIALLAVGLLLAVEAPDLRLRQLGRADLALLATWLGAALVWTAVWALNPKAAAAGPCGPVVTLAWSSSLYGMLALWWLFARRLGTGGGSRFSAT